MAFTEWMIRGPEIASCNCSYGCPCQFNALPTDGTCRAAVADADRGGTLRQGASSTAFGGPRSPPGRGPSTWATVKIQPIVDERATPEQREAS